MFDDKQTTCRASVHPDEIARDLRSYVDAGTQPHFGQKLLAIAAELELLAFAADTPRGKPD